MSNEANGWQHKCANCGVLHANWKYHHETNKRTCEGCGYTVGMGTSAQSDDEDIIAARRVKSAVEELNAAIQAAIHLGLKVELETMNKTVLDRGTDEPLVMCIVYKAIK